MAQSTGFHLRNSWLALAVAGLVLAGCQPIGAPLPNSNSFAWEPWLTGLQQPVDIAVGPHGVLYVVQRSGQILAVQSGRLLAQPALDLSQQITSDGGEQGLLSLAFHPRAAENQRLFVTYTAHDWELVLAEFQLTRAAVIDPQSGRVLLQIEQPHVNHNGGDLEFGPDGLLYLGVGDGGGVGDPDGNAQRLDTLLGKILRVDVDGAESPEAPRDNPFIGNAGARPEIWAYGLRNPWGMAFDRASDSLFVADVGQSSWEEINRIPLQSGGVNFGWNGFEGNHPYSTPVADWQAPIAEYSHDDGCAVTGGLVIRGQALPEWDGVYLYADACSGRIWGLRQRLAGNWRGRLLFDTDLRITRFGRGPSGEVLALDYRDRDGAVYQLLPAAR